MRKGLLLLPAFLLFLQSCKKEKFTDETRMPGITDMTGALPRAGGVAYGIDLNTGGEMAAIFDHDLYTTDATGTAWVLRDNTRDYYSAVFTPGNNILALSGSQMVRFDNTTSTVLSPPFTITNEWCIRSTATAIFAFKYYNQAYYSTDEGSTWTQISLPHTFRGLSVMQNNEILLVDYNSFSRSSDLGKTWKTYAASFPTVTPSWNGLSNGSFRTSTGRIFVFGLQNQDYYVSNDSGASFSQVSGPAPWALFMDMKEKNGFLYAAMGDHDANHMGGVYRSSDNGSSWSLLFPCKTREIRIKGNTMITVETTQPNTPNSAGVLRSDDLGQTWTGLGPDPITGTVDDFGLDQSGKLLLVSSGCLYRKEASGWMILAANGINGGKGKVATLPNGDLAFVTQSRYAWEFKGAYSSLLIKGDGTYKFLNNLFKSKGSDEWTLHGCIGTSKNEVMIAIGSYDMFLESWTDGKVYLTDAAHSTITQKTNLFVPENVCENANGNFFVKTVFSSIHGRPLGYKSTDRGNNWDRFEEDILPLTFKADNNFFGYSVRENNYWVSDIANSKAYQVELPADKVKTIPTRCLFDATGRLYFIADSRVYRTDTPLK